MPTYLHRNDYLPRSLNNITPSNSVIEVRCFSLNDSKSLQVTDLLLCDRALECHDAKVVPGILVRVETPNEANLWDVVNRLSCQPIRGPPILSRCILVSLDRHEVNTLSDVLPIVRIRVDLAHPAIFLPLRRSYSSSVLCR